MSEQSRTTGLEAGLVVTRVERELAVGHWLLSAAPDSRQGRREWEESGLTLVKCGGTLAAVRIPAELVHAAAGGAEPAEVDPYLREVLSGGAVFVDRYAQWYYALVPPSTMQWWSPRDFPGTVCLGRDAYLGVPAPRLTGPEEQNRSYWCVPMGSPGELCEADAVLHLVACGRARLAAAAQGVEVR